MTTVLISGGGIAGPALAHWLRRHGITPTIVERAPAPRTGGQAVDIRGAALDVADQMGLLAPLRAARTRMRGMSVLDGDGNEIMRSTEHAYSSGRLDNDDIEVLREDLVALLHESTKQDVEYLFDDSIVTLEQHEHDGRDEQDGQGGQHLPGGHHAPGVQHPQSAHDRAGGQDGRDGQGVRVTFEKHAPRTFDLVVGADGLHSTVRRLAFGPEEQYVHHLGTYLSIFTAPNFLGLEDWQVWIREGQAGAGIYPVRGNTELRVNLGFESDPLPYDHRDLDTQRRLIAERCGGLRWEVPKLLEAMQTTPDFYFDAMAQVRMPTWSQGRVTLLGDAGYCPSPLSGQGTSLALVGAYILATELAATDRNADHVAGYAKAFARYESRMRPFVELNQALATENPGGPASEESLDRAKNAITL